MAPRLLLCSLAVGTCGHASSRFRPHLPIDGLDVLAELAAAVQEAETRADSVQPVEDASGSQPRRPDVPHVFVASLDLGQNGTFFNSTFKYSASGSFAYDLDRKVTREELEVRVFPLARKLDLNASSVHLRQSNGTFQITGGTDPVCRAINISRVNTSALEFHDMFSWAASPRLSVFAGRETVGGRPCDRWRLNTTKTATEMSLCADGDAPVQLTIRSPQLSESYTFGNLTAVGSKVDQRLFDFPPACAEFPPPCQNASGPENLEVYRLHPGVSAADYDVADHNSADADGDALFVCSELRGSSSDRVSLFSLLVSPSFGQYGLCNGYPETSPPGPVCFGGDPRLVGREAPLSVGDGELRCAGESPIGFWYSLPRMGQCGAGETPGADARLHGCTWSLQKRLKTVTMDCLVKEQRLPEKCAADIEAGTGFHLSSRALALAFASENVSAGGCPDIGGPPLEEATILV